MPVVVVAKIPPPPDPPGWVTWPGNLPDCVNSWQEQPGDPRVRTSMDVGRPKTRRRYTGLVRKVNVTMILGNPDAGANERVIALMKFYEGAGDGTAHTGGCDGGYIYFKFRSPVDNIDHYYRFVKPPSVSNQGPLTFVASMEWENL